MLAYSIFCCGQWLSTFPHASSVHPGFYHPLTEEENKLKTTYCKWLALLCLFGISVTSFVTLAVTPNSNLSLKSEPRPEPPDLLTQYVSNRQALIVLGKALFWDMQVGSDGIQACGTCHFQAGADSRSKNQMSPGQLRSTVDTTPNPDNTFTSGKGPNYQLRTGDFPFHKLQDPLNRKSTVSYDTNDVASSQGMALRQFERNGLGCNNITSYLPDDVFKVSGINTRRVEPRHTPSVINAVFNHRNFWNGRAQDIFNGVNHRGPFDPDAHVYKLLSGLAGQPIATQVRIEQSSLASQATAPPASDTEMSAAGRPFLKIGKKLTNCKPLAGQFVHPDDSVLGSLSLYNTINRLGNHTPGINKTSYYQMIREAFRPEWWSTNYKIQVNADRTEQIVGFGVIGPNVYRLEEYNFSLFFGLAVQAYERELVSDDTPWDRFNKCGVTGSAADIACQSAALSSDQRAGADLFFSPRTRCANCHRGSALTDASVSQILGSITQPIKLGLTRLRTFETYTKSSDGTSLVVKQRQAQLIDTGFNNLGIRPTLEDLGVGGKFDPGIASAADLSIARRCLNLPDPKPTYCNLPATPTCFQQPVVLAVDGAVKIPGLRNVALTAPYFHNGGALTLSDVLDFYLRGSDFNPTDVWNSYRSSSTQIFPLVTLAGTNFDITSDPVCTPDITKATTPITAAEKNQLLLFLQALTDERVRTRQAPFDHPQLFVPNGHPGNTTTVTNDGTGYATDSLLEIPMTGRTGGTPLPTFNPLP